MAGPVFRLKPSNTQKNQEDPDAHFAHTLEPYVSMATGLASPLVYKEIYDNLYNKEVYYHQKFNGSSYSYVPYTKEVKYMQVGQGFGIPKRNIYEAAVKASKVNAAIGGVLTGSLSAVENVIQARSGVSSTGRAITNIVTDAALGAGVSYASTYVGAYITCGSLFLLG